MNKKYFIVISLLLMILIVAGMARLFSLPYPLFEEDYSTIVVDEEGNLLRAFLNKEEQWFFPPETGEVPEKLEKAVITYEDKRFWAHRGVDPIAVGRAIADNFKAGRIVSGASTISMQVIRLSRSQERTFRNKFREALRALTLEFHYSKSDILDMYLTHAPYGGNIIGYRAACLRYFGKEPAELTWGEAALLAVLPNDPGRVTPDNNRELLLKKRNNLLKVMKEQELFGEKIYEMSVREPIPAEQYQFDLYAPILARKLAAATDGNVIKTTINQDIQSRVRSTVNQQLDVLHEQGIKNCAVVISETDSGAVRAYIGSHNFFDFKNNGRIDGVQMVRSTGSVLKPFLYALQMEEGFIAPDSLLEDVPRSYWGYSPQNASGEFQGLVSARRALIDSLNVPAVNLLYDYGVSNFYYFLEEAGITTLDFSPSHYGLPLIIGGAESSLWEVTGLFQGLGNYGSFSGLHVVESQQKTAKQLLSPGASYLTMDILKELNRPGGEYYWQRFLSRQQLAWKTGTSFGNRDAWAVGVSPEWTIGVWVGNFDGRGNDNITGLEAAAPLLFRIFNSLPKNQTWFQEPEDLRQIKVSRETGYRLREDVERMETVKVPAAAEPLRLSPYEQVVFVNKEETEQVCSRCWEQDDVKKEVYQSYPALVVDYLRQKGRSYSLPAHRSSCPSRGENDQLEIIYPEPGKRILIPRGISGDYQQVNFKAAHSRENAVLYWYLNGSFIGQTEGEHNKFFIPPEGKNNLYIVDDRGYQRQLDFYVTRTVN